MKQRDQSLDFLRAVAVLLVISRHIKYYPGEKFSIGVPIHFLIQGGWVGVDLFFVLSGFLISGLLFKEYNQYGSISFKRFFIRRGFKIYPAFYFLILLTLIVGSGTYHISPFKITSEIFFLQDYLDSIWEHTWSLAIEEKFYILLPFLLILISKRRKPEDIPFKQIPVIFIFVSVLCLGLRMRTGITTPFTFPTHFFPFHLRMDSLFFGVLLSWFYHYHQDEFRKTAKRCKFLFLFAGILLLSQAFTYNLKTLLIHTVGFTYFYLGSGLILVGLMAEELNPKNLFIKIITTIGAHSYSIYLWHIPVFRWCPRLLKPLLGDHFTWASYTICYILLSIGFGIWISRMIEFPLLKVRDRLFPPRASNLEIDVPFGFKQDLKTAVQPQTGKDER